MVVEMTTYRSGSIFIAIGVEGKVCLLVILILLAVGLVIFLWDADTIHRYGFHMTEVTGLSEAGEPIDWPTGEQPLLMQIPISIYALVFCLAAAVIFSLRLQISRRSPKKSGETP
jgi:hypothetical protein